ncbi:MAG: hypothetical protein K2X87_03780 [Gemmataceae bacterium]|nr:hypothetical protein [Gemmataceae bacterium]
MSPGNPLPSVLADAREAARANGPGQVDRVAREIGVEAALVGSRLDAVADLIEVRITRSLAVGRYLLAVARRGRVPVLRTVFETGRQDHTQDPVRIAAVVDFRRAAEARVFGATDVPEEDRPRYGFAYLPDSPTEPYPFGPVRFVLNLSTDELRGRITLTPVDSSLPELGPDEVGTFDHPHNALARSSDALAVAGLLGPRGPVPPGCGVWANGTAGGVPEAQVWGPVEVTPAEVAVIVVGRDAAAAQPAEFAALREVAARQAVELRVEDD